MKLAQRQDGAAVGTHTLWTSAGCLIWSIPALPSWWFHLSQVGGRGRGNGYLALNPGNKETLVIGKGWNPWEKTNRQGILELMMVQEKKKENKHSLNTYCMPPTSYALLHLIPMITSEGGSTSLPCAKKQKMHKGKITGPRSSCAHLSACKLLVLTSHRVAEQKRQGVAQPDNLDLKRKWRPSIWARGCESDNTHTPQSQNHDTVTVLSLSPGSFLEQAATVLWVVAQLSWSSWDLLSPDASGCTSIREKALGEPHTADDTPTPPPLRRSSTHHFRAQDPISCQGQRSAILRPGERTTNGGTSKVPTTAAL